MRYETDRHLLWISIFMIAIFTGCVKTKPWLLKDVELKGDWKLQTSAKISEDGERIASLQFRPEGWYKAMVPGSVLGSLVADSVYTNVFHGRNLANIPDSLFDIPWWYRTTFTMGKINAGQVTRLRFNGINYKADIWLNGRKIAASDTVEGGFRRFTFKVSDIVKEGENVLAVKLTRPYPGDLTLGFVDWNPNPPDHNMGIWRTVKLLVSGPVSIDQPFVQTKVDTATLDQAALTISTLLHNHSDRPVKGILKGNVGHKITFEKQITLQPGESREVVFDPAHDAQLIISHPKLWWVHTWGKPNLYDLHLQFEAGQSLSDTAHIRFGIRQVTDYITADGHRGFKLNGKKILIKGGGWTDPMLLNATPAYEEAGIDYAVHMNLNTIRMEGFWGHDQHLYNLCDEKGLLIMVGLSCQWEWKEYLGTKEDQYSAIITPEQNEVAARSWQDQIVWLRHHPSIFLWLYGSDKWPRPALEKRYLAILKKYDNTRPAISSAAEHTSELTGLSAVKMRGPYDYVPPVYWYADTANGGAFGFNTETGPGPEVPVRESLEKMIPADSLWPVGSAWLYHAARHNFHNLTAYDHAIIQRLGTPVDLHDYLRKAQYINYEGMRAMFEAFESNRFKATGIIQWMLNASWPKLWWQLYDYYLMPTAAFYGAKKANEPIHIAFNYGKDAVEIINNTLDDKENLSATIKIFDINAKQVLQKTIAVKVLKGRQTKEVLLLPDTMALSKTWFLDVRLCDQGRRLLSANCYALSAHKDELEEKKTTWFATPQSQYADLTMLQHLPQVTMQVNPLYMQRNDTTFASVTLKNPAHQLAFMVHLDLKKNSQESVVPVFWDDNYITLLPGEEREIKGYCQTEDLGKGQPEVVVDGWNIK